MISKIMRNAQIPSKAITYFYRKNTKPVEQLNKPEVEESKILKVQKTYAERDNIHMLSMLTPILGMFGLCLINSDPAFNSLYFYSLIGAQTISSFALFANITFPQNKQLKYLMIGGLIGCSAIPILNPLSITTQLAQFALLLQHDREPIDESKQLSQDEIRFVKNRIGFKLGFFMCIVGTILFKGYYLYQVQRMQNKIKELNQRNVHQKVTGLV